MPADALADELGRLEAAHAALVAHPLSSRKTWLLAVLLDNFCDTVFEARRGDRAAVLGAEDVLAFRARVQGQAPALRLIAALCAGRPAGPRLETAAVEVPIADYHRLSVTDYMVSLYNGNTVQRVLIVMPDGTRHLALDTLGDALGFWRAALAR